MHDILLFLVGIVVGAMNAIAGGGMLIGFPALLAVGIPAISANATTGLIVIPGQLSSIAGYRKFLQKVPRRYLLLFIPLIIGSACGAELLRHTPANRFADFAPGLIIFAVTLFIFQPFLYRYIHKHIHGSKVYQQKWTPLVVTGLVLLPIATYGAYFGAGFGFIMLAFLGFTKLNEIHRMNALKNIAGTAVAGTALICLSSSGLINWRHGLFMAAGASLGGFFGARLSQRVSSHLIRIVVIMIGLTAAAWLAIRTY